MGLTRIQCFFSYQFATFVTLFSHPSAPLVFIWTGAQNHQTSFMAPKLFSKLVFFFSKHIFFRGEIFADAGEGNIGGNQSFPNLRVATIIRHLNLRLGICFIKIFDKNIFYLNLLRVWDGNVKVKYFSNLLVSRLIRQLQVNIFFPIIGPQIFISNSRFKKIKFIKRFSSYSYL